MTALTYLAALRLSALQAITTNHPKKFEIALPIAFSLPPSYSAAPSPLPCLVWVDVRVVFDRLRRVQRAAQHTGLERVTDLHTAVCGLQFGQKLVVNFLLHLPPANRDRAVRIEQSAAMRW